MKQKVFDKNEIIYRKNDPSVDMFIVLFGDVGLYNTDGIPDSNNKPDISIKNNNSFGDKALNSMELRKETAIAKKVTVCLVLNKFDYEEKVFYLEHQKKLNRLEYLMH